MKHWMIYGANGYTGALIAREAQRRGLKPVLAGRNQHQIEKLAAELGLEFRIFDLEQPQPLQNQLSDVQLVLHCAGPFSSTSLPMIRACIDAGTHYLDISGEIAVFEHAHSQDSQAKKANIVLCPGVGFDVIPTDCLAASLKKALPDASTLLLGFDSSSGLSPGTAKTAVEGLAKGGKARIDGEITTVPLAWKTRMVDFGRGEKLATTIAWGDVSTAYYTTAIPNIEVYIPMSQRKISLLKKMNYIRWLLGFGPVQSFLKKKASAQIGPDAEQLKTQLTYVWGEVSNTSGERKTARITTANGYALTVSGSLAVVEFVLNHPVQGGYTTPAQLMGDDLVSRLAGSGNLQLM